MKEVLKKPRKKSYYFNLKNINVYDIAEKYNIPVEIESNISEIFNDEKNNITSLEDLRNDNKVLSYLNNNNKMIVNIIDNQNYQHLNCFWDRHPISSNNHPIGCPIKYIPNEIHKMYFSDITKEKYYIKQNISQFDNNIFVDNSKQLIENNYYETVGIFCSFPCCLAYINDNVKDMLYVHSKFLLYKMFFEMYDNKIDYNIIKPAPSWKLLCEYGGNMNIETFRQSTQQYKYIETNYIIKNIPNFKPIGSIYEEQFIF